MNEKKGKLLIRVVGIVLAVMTAVSVTIIVIGACIISNTYKDLIVEELKVSCEHLDSAVSSLNDNGDWSMEEDNLLKGGEPIAEEIEGVIDNLRKETGVDYTIFWGDTRVLTTICKAGTSEKLVGTKASDAVISTTLNNGEDFHSTTLNIEGLPYYGYYLPLKNSDGSVVGMVFTGRNTSDVEANIRKHIFTMAIVAIFGILFAAGIGVFIALRSSKKMKSIAEYINTLSTGSLGNDSDPALLSRKDELGAIAECADGLDKKLKDTIKTVREASSSVMGSSSELAETAKQISGTADGVSEAVQEMAKGATEQAENMQKATENIGMLSDAIKTVSDNAEVLAGEAAEMGDASSKSIEALQGLSDNIQNMSVAIEAISEVMTHTNTAVERVNEKIDGITNIATQTNLLALNASIEAAHAGDAGRGFAVVAEEIGKLAAESAQTADEIKKEMSNLLDQSQEASVKTNEISEIENIVSQVVSETVETINGLIANVTSTVDSVNNISGLAEECNATKEEIVDVMSNLSAISQENAASTEETSASMQELNATVNILAASAESLQGIAENLEQELEFFKINENEK